MLRTKKERTVAIQRSLQDRSKHPIAYFDSRKYIQHNVALGDGLAPILEFMDALPADRTRVDVRRAFEDGDYSVAHAEYELGDWGRVVGFEVHRWEDDRIVEHWDNLEPPPDRPNPSGRTMVDGATAVVDLDRTHANKALVERFTADVLIGRRTGRAAPFFDADALIQHSPRYGDGVPALIDVLDRAARAADGPEYLRLHKVLGEGNFVLAMSEGTLGGAGPTRQPAAFYDLYRLADGVIAEHWDVTEIIPPRDTWRNTNGKF